MPALFLKNATVTVDGADASEDADNVEFTPTTTAATFTPISGTTQSDSGATSWVCNMNIAQNFTAGSLFMLMYEADEPIDVVLKPRGTASGPTITATIVPVPAKIGGGAGALTASVSCQVNGKPTIAAGA
ncbi:major tail protein [Arthrobacter phage Yavru]|uniref:Major tail protein n=1 Tax=Arthrobacter phage Yavru TaxID=2776857 RepID=A0A7M1CLK5_9CAUD|nr:major tail protein [Arthrobacter phage Yavru]QOP64219.1 major tail protein [Arthrobacter phage Yavru]